jgi:hypothetical protein
MEWLERGVEEPLMAGVLAKVDLLSDLPGML